jgi:DNA-binding transcriptional regulator YhcF (GntR family)
MEKTFEKESVFIEYFGDCPILRIIDFLIEDYLFDYSKKEIAKQSGVAWNTFKKYFDRLVEHQFVIRTRKVGKSEMFMINKENLIVQKLFEINKALMLNVIKEADKEAKITEAKPIEA